MVAILPSARPVLKKKAAGCKRSSSSSIRGRREAGRLRLHVEGRAFHLLRKGFHQDAVMRSILQKGTGPTRREGAQGSNGSAAHARPPRAHHGRKPNRGNEPTVAVSPGSG